MTSRSSKALDRIAKARAAAERQWSPDAHLTLPAASSALVHAFGADRAARIMQGLPDERAVAAAQLRFDVERMSRDGTPVAMIAATLGVSYGYVVQLRAQLGVGRRR
jgi:hypothetical protein